MHVVYECSVQLAAASTVSGGMDAPADAAQYVLRGATI
jgi:hypothetical protein